MTDIKGTTGNLNTLAGEIDNRRLYAATFAADAAETVRDLKIGAELNHLCISRRLDADKYPLALKEMKNQVEEAGGPERVIMHGPFTELCPASIDHLAVELAFLRLGQAYDSCVELGVKRMVVHTGYMPLIYFKEWHLQRSLEFWKKFMADKPADFQLYIENVFEDEPYMMKDLIDGLDDPRISMCLDVGHANALTADDMPVEKWIAVLGKRIHHMHLHNNDGKNDLHAPVTEGVMDMASVLAAVAAECDAPTMTIESRTCRESAEWILGKR